MKTKVPFLFVLALLTSACAPEIGSKAWCEKMDEKPKGDWSANEAAEYAKSCLFGEKEENEKGENEKEEN